MTAPIRVMVVDDSAFARKVMRELLSAEPDIEVVGFARDGLDALEKISELAPDVITLDLVMPELDGVGVLRALAEREKPPRAVVVSIADDESDIGVAALTAGAFTIVHKPTAIATDRLYDLRAELLANVRAAAVADAPRLRPTGAMLPVDVRDPAFDLVVIGASTGGPQAVAHVLSMFGADFPVPIAIVLHMPVGYTAGYADRLDRDGRMDVREAREGLLLAPGMAVIGHAGSHLKLLGAPGSLTAHLDLMPLGTPHRPAVDVLFTSAAERCGARVLGVVLTGMGDDGTAGARAIKDAGGKVIVESKSSCVVYGMPRAVRDAGLADAEVPLDRVAVEIVERLRGAR